MHIKQPCPVSTNHLIPKGNNCFHCKNCNKTVIDFTALSQHELEKQLEKDVCGIFRTDQLDKKSVFSWKKHLLFTLFTIISFFGGKIAPVQASELRDSTTGTQVQNKNSTKDCSETKKTC